MYGEDTPKCLQMLGLGELDLAITLEPIKNMEIEFVPCYTDELRIVLPTDHEWAKQEAVDWTNLSSQNFILDNRASYSFRMINDYLEKNGLKLTSFMEISKLGCKQGTYKTWIGYWSDG